MGFVDKITLANEIAALGRQGFDDEEALRGDDDVFSSSVPFQTRSSAKRRRRSTGSSDADGSTGSSSDANGTTDILWPTIALRLTRQDSCDSCAQLIDVGAAEFQLKRVIGSGGFGRAYLGETSQPCRTGSKRKVVGGRYANRRRRCLDDSCRNPSVVVVKLIAEKTGNGNGASIAASLRSEENAIGLDHPNVARTLGTGWTTPSPGSSPLWTTSGNSPARKWSSGAVDQLLSATTTDVKMAAVVMEFAGDVSLQHVIDDVKEIIDFSRRVRFAHDIASALAYLHSRCVVHLDVKPANVVINRLDDRCKLIDFGCSIRLASHLSPMSSSPISNSLRLNHDIRPAEHCAPAKRHPPALGPALPAGGCGTLQYRAPELLRNFGGSGASSSLDCSFGRDFSAYKSDVYSFGVTLWQLVERRTPYDDQFDSPLTVAYNVVKYRARPDGTSTSPHRVPQQLVTVARETSDESSYRTLYAECWNDDPNRRPSANELARVFDRWCRH